MNTFVKEIANILEAQIDNKPYNFQQSGLTLEQIEEVNKFASKYSRSGFGFYPLKNR